MQTACDILRALRPVSHDTDPSASPLRYAADETPPAGLSVLLAFQIVMLNIGGIALTPLIVLQAAGAMAWADWAVFAALVTCGLFTVLQARPVGTFGAGYLLFMGTSGAFIAVGISAVREGGLPLLGTLVVVSSLIQFLFATRLGLLRRIVTPTVGGTVITLIAVTVVPIAFDMLALTPANFTGHAAAAPVTAVTTFLVVAGISLFARGALRLWGPLVGVVVGCAVAGPLGLIDLAPVRGAAWLGLPSVGWPGLDLRFDTAFWLLLPGFLICTLIGAIETFGDGIAIQHVSRRGRRPIDYREVQGAVNADGAGNLFSGLFATLPNTTYSTSISIVELTGVAARRVGVFAGVMTLLLAFSPKVSALLQAIPAPVVGAFLTMLLVLLFAHGLQLVLSGGLTYENGIVFGLAFWLGSGFQSQALFPDLLPAWAHEIFDNGMTSGGVVALLLSALLALKTPPARRLNLPAEPSAVGALHAFARESAGELRWREDAVGRLELACEEALLFLTEKEHGAAASGGRGITVLARRRGSALELEFLSAPQAANVGDLIARLEQGPGDPIVEARLRLLRHLVTRLEHRQFNEGDFLLLLVEGEPGRPG